MAKYEHNRIKVPRFNEASGFYTSKVRSDLMSKIKSKNTKPEIALRKALWAEGLRYRIDYSKLPGKPDVVIHKHHLAIFIDGEFWHGYNWADKKNKIKANRDFWIPKIERNMQRDVENNTKLIALGYIVLRFWEHEIKKNLPACVQTIISYTRK